MDIHWKTGGRDDLDRTFRRVEGITAVGSLIGYLEQLNTSSAFADGEIFGWPVLNLAHPGLRTGLGKHVAKIMEYPNVVALLQTKGLAALGLLLPGASRAQRGVLGGSMCVTSVAMQARMPFGLDGSDHFALINYVGATLEKLFPHDPLAREAAVAFVGVQSCLSYFSSGFAKLVSPVWRDGSAIPHIFRTATYGDRDFYRIMRDRPNLAKALAWATILGEMSFPLVLLAPKPIARAILGAGVAFHLANARFMGLNRFVWSFAGTYPAVWHLSQRIRPVVAAKAWPMARDLATRPTTGKATAAVLGAAAMATAGMALLGTWRQSRLGRTAPGDFVQVGGKRVHVLAKTTGNRPAVIFESAMACPATEWSWTIGNLPKETPYLAFDRPGNGWSEPSGHQDAAQAVTGLKELIETLGLKPPFIMVGHSVGGLLIRSFALRHPDLIGGLVFVDSTHPDQLDRSGTQRQGVAQLKQAITRNYLRGLAGTVGKTLNTGAISALPGTVAKATHDCMTFPQPWRAARREYSQWQTSWAPDARKLTTLSPRPVAVLTAGKTASADPVHGLLQRELAELSTVSLHEIVDESDHDGLVMRPEHAARVAAGITWVDTMLTAPAATVQQPEASR